MLKNDISRCAGQGSNEDGWREGCEDCARRLDVADGVMYSWIAPPAIIVFWCESHIAKEGA